MVKIILSVYIRTFMGFGNAHFDHGGIAHYDNNLIAHFDND
jgi:hypothetical protein